MNRVLIVHHNDDDGVCAAAAASFYGTNGSNVRFKAVNYDQDLQEILGNIVHDFDAIFFVDYSISKEENARFVLELYNHPKKVVKWFDHHKSSIDFIESNPKYHELIDIGGYRIIGIAGCALVWLYYNNDLVSDQTLLYDTIARNNSNISVSYDDARSLVRYAPSVIQYVHRYDIWDPFFKDMTNLFHYGWDYKDPVEYYTYLHKDYNGDIIRTTIEKGKAVKSYIDSENKEHCEDNGFDITIRFEKDGIVKDYSCFALNTYHCTSLAFGDLINKYDIVMPIFFTGKKWRHSMYTVKDNIDVSEICIVLGGGGHPKAAGYTSDQLDIYPDTIISVYK